MAYAPTAWKASEPVAGNIAGTAAEEFRTIKAVMAQRFAPIVPFAIGNSAALTSGFITLIPGTMLGTNRRLSSVFWGQCVNNTGGNIQFVFTLNYGATQFFSSSIVLPTAGLGYAYKFESQLENIAAANIQRGFGEWTIYGSGSGASVAQAQQANYAATSALTVDSSINQNFFLNVQMNVASPNAIISIDGGDINLE